MPAYQFWWSWWQLQVHLVVDNYCTRIGCVFPVMCRRCNFKQHCNPDGECVQPGHIHVQFSQCVWRGSTLPRCWSPDHRCISMWMFSFHQLVICTFISDFCPPQRVVKVYSACHSQAGEEDSTSFSFVCSLESNCKGLWSVIQMPTDFSFL